MQFYKNTVFLVFVILFSACQQNDYQEQWSAAFLEKELQGTFLLYDTQSDKLSIYNEARSDSAFSPASTFKICNALIGLQCQAVNSIDDTIRWSGHQYPWDGWNQDHCLRTAMPVSCVWFYQSMARRIGRATMQSYLDALPYGNAMIGDAVDLFWLDGSLQISAREQLAFLQRLISNDLPFDEQVQDDVKEIIITEQNDDYTMHAKTGWAMRVENPIGWYVGYVEQADNKFIFVLNYDMRNPKKQAKYRKLLTYELLAIAGVIDLN